jgi:hypothetical protein
MLGRERFCTLGLVDKASDAPWASPPAASLQAGPGERRGESPNAPWADPPELVAVRAGVAEAQERVVRATRQLELAAELEARLQSLLDGRTVEGVPPVPSPQRRAAELKATGILLKAELRAAKILNSAGSPGNPGSYKPAALDVEAAQALEEQLAQLADVESALALIGRELIDEGLTSELSPSGLALGEADKRKLRPAGQSGPVPLFRRPRRGKRP